MVTFMKEKCPLCERISHADTSYCSFHDMAHTEIKSRFLEWNIAFGYASWERYLERIIGLKETGVWAREVARLELRRFKDNSKATFKNT